MTEAAPRSVRARSFDAWAAEYDRYRPSYPSTLFDLITDRLSLPDEPAVADVGAGTGKASLAMASRGWRVTAVEPGGTMLAVLRDRALAAGLKLETVLAPAEDTTLPSGGFDLVTAAEAYHWFDAPRALREIGRILRPGGGLACFWNVRDADSSKLLAEYEELRAIVGAEPRPPRRPGPREETRSEILASGLFERPTFEQVPHEVAMTGAELVGLAFTSSHVRTADAAAQDRFRAELEALLMRHGISSATSFGLPYVVDCWIGVRSTRTTDGPAAKHVCHGDGRLSDPRMTSPRAAQRSPRRAVSRVTFRPPSDRRALVVIVHLVCEPGCAKSGPQRRPAAVRSVTAGGEDHGADASAAVFVERVSPLHAALGGIVAGATGALALTVVIFVARLVTHPPAAEASDAARGLTPGRALAEGPGTVPDFAGATSLFVQKLAIGLFGVSLDARQQHWAGAAWHLAYGAGWGLLFGVIAASVPVATAVLGLAYGVWLWLLGPVWLIPKMRLMVSPRAAGTRVTLLVLGGHVAYGLILALVFTVIRAGQ